MTLANSGARQWKGAFALVCLVIVVGGGLAAWFVYPRVTYPIRSAAVLADIQTTRTIAWTAMQIADDVPEDDIMTLELEVWAEGSLSDQIEETVDLFVIVPTVVGGSLDCGKTPACKLDIFTSIYASPYRSNRAQIAVKWAEIDEPRSSGTLYAKASLDVRNYSPVACTEYACRGSVPRIFVHPGVKVSADAAVQAMIALPGLAGIRWDSDYLAGDSASPYLQFHTPLDESTELAYQTRFDFDGTDEAAAQSASQRLFLAGALVGVAGGALIAAGQEGIGWWLMRPPRPPAAPARRPHP